MVSLAFLVLMTTVALCAPLVALLNGHPPNALTHQYEMTTDLGLPKGPNFELNFWLGADQFGRDLLTRTAYGARISLLVGLASTILALIVGCAVGVLSGFLRGPVDTALSRSVDVVLSFPILLLALAIRAVFGASLWIMIIVVAFATWPFIARIVRGQALVIREREYVVAARALGASNLSMMWRHVLPNLVGPLVVYGTLNILLEASLSYLGLGLPPRVAMPQFLLGIGLIYLFYFRIHVFPAPGYVALTSDPFGWATHLLLPWFTLAFSYAAAYSRIMRSSMLEVANENVVLLAQSKGLTRRQVILRHVVRPALTPIVTMLGMDSGLLLSGAIVVEIVFGLNGVGSLAIQALTTNDLPVIAGTVLLAAILVAVFNLVVDLLYPLLDPRVQS